MGSPKIFGLLCGGLLLLGGIYAFQRPFREYPGAEYEDFPLPPDYQEKTEWVFARLMYPPFSGGRGYRYRYGGDWTQGASNWTIDYPRSDRHFAQAKHLRRTPTPFAGDQLVTIALRPHEKRLDHALFLDGIGQLAKGCFGEILERL